MSNDPEKSNFSKYGVYTVNENLELILPETMVKFERIGENVFSYSREDSEGNLSEKIIPTISNSLTIELSPIRPLNHPAKRTNYMYLDFTSPIFLSEFVSATIFVTCPIEIGIFIIHDGHKDSLDWFTCNPLDSRFGLYGTPELGTLCKYVQSDIVQSYDDSTPFINGVMKINLKNELESGKSVSKSVFPLSDYSLYYKNNLVIFDTANIILKKKALVESTDVSSLKIDTDWTAAPSYERIQPSKRLNMGVD